MINPLNLNWIKIGRYDKRHTRTNISKSVCILAVCTLIGLLFYLWGLSEANIITIYILGILLISSITTEWIYGLISSALGVLLFNCLFAIPRFTLFFYDWQYSITTIIMFATSLAVSLIMAQFRRQLETETLATQRSEVLLETSQVLQGAYSQEDIFALAAIQLNRLHGQTALIFPVAGGKLEDPIIKGTEVQLDLQRKKLEKWIDIKDDMFSEVLSKTEKIVYFKVKADEKLFAIAGIFTKIAEEMTNFEMNLIQAMLDEVAFAIDKQRLRTENEQIEHKANTERLRSDLLRTISHDLRTPLTSISGNADMLINSGEEISLEIRRQMYQSIHDDSEWLIGIVENLLFITRFENGAMSLQLQSELVQDMLPEILRYFNKRKGNHTIIMELPEELLIVRVDAHLIMQVIVNFVDNALKYTPPDSEITIRAYKDGEQAVIEVADNGSGVKDEDKPKIFDMFYTADNHRGDGRRETGLGLTLCQSIVRAHGGTIYVKDNDITGAIFGFRLKLEEVHLEREYTGN